jgi:hypothetical protein
VKYLLFLIILLASCTTEPEPEKAVEKVKVKYLTNAHNQNVNYCDENGNVKGLYGITKLDTVIYMERGVVACISTQKTSERNNINAKVRIYINDSLVAEDSGPMIAGVSYEIP